SRYRTSLDNIKKQDLEIQKITSDNTKKDEEITKLRATNAKYKGTEDPAAVLALKQEIANLREQLAKVKSAKNHFTKDTVTMHHSTKTYSRRIANSASTCPNLI
ncbi:19326_t:CDS:2, partial [Entrophospora sp. SA101]